MTLQDRETFQAWVESPLTREFLSLLEAKHRHLKDKWGSGWVLSPEEQAQAVLLGQLARICHSDGDDKGGGARPASIMDFAVYLGKE